MWDDLLLLLENNPVFGLVLYVAIFILCALLFVPVTFPTILAGYLYRPTVFAIFIVLIASQLSIISALYIAQIVFPLFNYRPTTTSAKQLVIAISSLGEQGWFCLITGAWIVFLMRLSPIFPFGITNYLLAATTITTPQVLIGSFFGNMPGAITYCVLGSFMKKFGDSIEIPLKYRIIGGLLSICIGISTISIITFLARAELRFVLAKTRNENEEDVSVIIGADLVQTEISTYSLNNTDTNTGTTEYLLNERQDGDLEIGMAPIVPKGMTSSERHMLYNIVMGCFVFALVPSIIALCYFE